MIALITFALSAGIETYNEREKEKKRRR